MLNVILVSLCALRVLSEPPTVDALRLSTLQNLRQKLEDDPTQPTYILTETGVGYRFQP